MSATVSTGREPEENPSPTRAVFRIVFVILILAGFVALLVYHFLGSPDVWVEQINLKDKKNFARCSLYGGNDCKETPFMFSNATTYVKRRPVVCPCNNTNVKWRDFVRFYILYQNSTEWGVSFYLTGKKGKRDIPHISVPTLPKNDFTSLRDHVVKSAESMNITTDEFCNLAYYWPPVNAPTVRYPEYVCQYMASTLLPVGSSTKFPINTINRTTEFFESPTLLNYEVFKIRVAERARESILKGRLDLDIINLYDRNFTKEYNLYANMLTRALDRIDNEEWYSYYQRAIELEEDLNFIKNLKDSNPWMIYLSGKRAVQDKKPLRRPLYFLHVETDWKNYEKACDPLYCEETKRMSAFRQAYRAFGLLGGVATLVLGLVTVLLWPAFGLLLNWCCNTPAAVESVVDEHHEAPFLPGAHAPDPASAAPVNIPAGSSGANFHRRSSQKQEELC